MVRRKKTGKVNHKTTRQLKAEAKKKLLEQRNRIKRLQRRGEQFTPAKVFTRLCPSCDETITHELVKERNRHEKRMTLCRSCSRTRANKRIGANPYKRSARSRQLRKPARERMLQLLKRLTDETAEYEHIRQLMQDAERGREMEAVMNRPAIRGLLDRLLGRMSVDDAERLRNLLG